MKYVPCPNELSLHIRNCVTDEPMTNGIETRPDAIGFGKPKPFVVLYREFLLARTLDEAFATHGGRKDGLDLLELQQLARRQIRTNLETPSKFHAFDSDVAARLRQSILKPLGNGGFFVSRELDFNFLDWALCWKPEPRDQLPAVMVMEPRGSITTDLNSNKDIDIE